MYCLKKLKFLVFTSAIKNYTIRLPEIDDVDTTGPVCDHGHQKGGRVFRGIGQSHARR